MITTRLEQQAESYQTHYNSRVTQILVQSVRFMKARTKNDGK